MASEMHHELDAHPHELPAAGAGNAARSAAENTAARCQGVISTRSKRWPSLNRIVRTHGPRDLMWFNSGRTGLAGAKRRADAGNRRRTRARRKPLTRRVGPNTATVLRICPRRRNLGAALGGPAPHRRGPTRSFLQVRPGTRMDGLSDLLARGPRPWQREAPLAALPRVQAINPLGPRCRLDIAAWKNGSQSRTRIRGNVGSLIRRAENQAFFQTASTTPPAQKAFRRSRPQIPTYKPTAAEPHLSRPSTRYITEFSNPLAPTSRRATKRGPQSAARSLTSRRAVYTLRRTGWAGLG